MENENPPTVKIIDEQAKRLGKFVIITNHMRELWIRPLGPTAFTVWYVLKSFCQGDSEVTLPSVSQEDWAEYCGISTRSFITVIQKLVKYELLEIIEPKKKEEPYTYILKEPPNTISDKIKNEKPDKGKNRLKPFSNKCKFNDPIFAWPCKIFRAGRTAKFAGPYKGRNTVRNTFPFSKEKAFPFGTQTAGNPANAIVQRGGSLAQSTSERMRASTDPLVPPIKPTKPVSCSPIIQEMIDYWNSKPLRHLSQDNGNPTKTYRNTVCNLKKLLLGTFFKEIPLTPTYRSFVKFKYTVADFKETVDRFVIMATNPDFRPQNKKPLLSMSISDFLYSDRMTHTPSHFLYCLNCELNKIKTAFHKDPKLTDMLVLRYKETTSMSFQPSSAQMDKFIMASNRLANFFEKNKHRLNGGITHKVWNEKNKVDLLLNAVYADTNGLPISPGWLCSNDTFDRRLPVYFEDHRF